LKILIVIGTRPEAIKMAILYKKLYSVPGMHTRLLLTGQQKNIVANVLLEFGIEPDAELPSKEKHSDLSQKSAEMIVLLQDYLGEYNPDLVLVHGDTLSAYCGAYVAFMNRIPVGHVEAGLRSGNRFSPFPEEMFRILIDKMSCLYFAPTQGAVENLQEEKLSSDRIFLTGNTVVDALNEANSWHQDRTQWEKSLSEFIDQQKAYGRKLILLTMHRRENRSTEMYGVLKALKELVIKRDIAVIYTQHPSVSLQESFLDENSSQYIFNTKAMAYGPFVRLMKEVDLILSDSGGIQEEAPYLSKTVLILRKETERPEAVEEGFNCIYDMSRLGQQIEECLTKTSTRSHLYGEGYASEKIADIIEEWFKGNH